MSYYEIPQPETVVKIALVERNSHPVRYSKSRRGNAATRRYEK